MKLSKIYLIKKISKKNQRLYDIAASKNIFESIKNEYNHISVYWKYSSAQPFISPHLRT